MNEYCKYIDAKTFSEFKINQESALRNQDKLINILNHNITKMTQDVSWIKALMIGLSIALVANMLGGFN